MATTEQKRKTGDAVILSGQLKGSLDLFANVDDWIGAVAEIHIVENTTARTIVREAACEVFGPIALSDEEARYRYIGEPIDEGKYLYEVQVTFVNLADPLTWPNDKTKFKLTLVPELA